MSGIQQVEKLDVFERIADGLGLPDPARISLGLAPRRPPTSHASGAGPARSPVAFINSGATPKGPQEL